LDFLDEARVFTPVSDGPPEIKSRWRRGGHSHLERQFFDVPESVPAQRPFIQDAYASKKHITGAMTALKSTAGIASHRLRGIRSCGRPPLPDTAWTRR